MERANELLKAINKYFSSDDGTNMRYYGTGSAAKAFADIFQTGEKLIGDAPDMLICKNDEALIIEHFEFDSYRVTQKGSQNRREQSRIDRLEDKLVPTESGICFHDKIHGHSSYENYIQNVCRNFEEHFRRIDTYKENLRDYGLIDDTKAVKVLFFIEDTSPLGSMVVDPSKNPPSVQPINLGQCQEFLSLLNSSPDVDYVLACSMAGSIKVVWFIDRNEVGEYLKESIDYSKMQFIGYEAQVLGFQLLIPNELDTEEMEST